MKKHTFILTLEFEDKIVDDADILTVQKNIVRGIVEQINHAGIVPEDSDNFTKTIEVYQQFNPNEKVVLDLMKWEYK